MKHAEVKSGTYTGKMAVILGTDRDYLGHSIIKENNQMGWDYIKRWGLEGFPISDPVLICNVDGQMVALSQSEFTKGKNDKASGKGKPGSKGTKGSGKSDD